MNPEEKIAQKYLEGLDAGPIVYEPDGNNPPDFSIDGSVAVEVRRLNQHYFGANDPEGLEELSIPLRRDLRDVLSEFDDKYDGDTYGVFVKYERPSKGSGKDTADAVRDALVDFLDSGGAQARVTLCPSETLELEVVPIPSTQDTVFRLAGSMDWDSGGWTMGIYEENISYCIQDKRQKVSSHIHRYDTWWIILVDLVDVWGFYEEEKVKLQSGLPNLETFKRLFVISQGANTRLDISR